jgi:hypothetical protein
MVLFKQANRGRRAKSLICLLFFFSKAFLTATFAYKSCIPSSNKMRWILYFSKSKKILGNKKDLKNYCAEILELFILARRFQEGLLFFERYSTTLAPHTNELSIFLLCRCYAETAQFEKQTSA